MSFASSDEHVPVAGGVPLMVAVLGAGFVSGIIPNGLLPANLLNIEQAYGFSHEQMGRIVGMCMLFGGTGGLISGWVCGRIGALRTLLVSLVLLAVGMEMMGLLDSAVGVIGGLAVALFGLGFMGSASALAVHMFSDRQRGVVLLHALNASGKFCGPMLATAFLYGAWRNSFSAAAAMTIVLVIPALLAKADGQVSIGRKPDKGPRAQAGFWICVAGFALISGSEISVALWLPAFCEKSRGFTAAQSNAMLAIFLLGLMAGRFSAGALSKWVSSKRAIGICGCATVFVLPAITVPAYPVAAVFFFLFGVAYSATWPSYFAHLSRVYPDHLGLLSGVVIFATQVGFAVCSEITGRLAGADLSYPLLFGASVMAAFVVVFFASPISKRAKQTPLQ